MSWGVWAGRRWMSLAGGEGTHGESGFTTKSTSKATRQPLPSLHHCLAILCVLLGPPAQGPESHRLSVPLPAVSPILLGPIFTLQEGAPL